jgi:cyclic pyranopterin phosphate synthase
MTAQRRVHAKPLSFRQARASGELHLRASTRRSLGRGAVAKGDPFPVAEVAGLLAMKRTHELIPHCHPIPLTGAEVRVTRTARGVRAVATAEALYRTGVEMEALVGVSVALLTVWDMVKYLEKDGDGQYPRTRMEAVRVVEKRKEPRTERARR